MLYSQSPPLAEQQWPRAEEISSGGLARDLDVRSDRRMGGRRTKPSVDSSHSYRFGEGPMTSGRPSIGRRIVRSLIRFSITVLIGVGATLGWQSYGDAAKEMAVARAPALAWLLPTSTTKSPAVAATSAGPVQLEPLASNLDAVRRSVEQLANKQEQIAQNVAALRAVQEDIRQKMSLAPSSPAPAPQAASTPQPSTPQPRAQSSSAPRPSSSTGTLTDRDRRN
ncbi:hypothetical protein [Bradyrhizobium paxllaeri]|uniref:hypothetical protein n=1 Tax=Bradyrhizobium paxllaeri TaxID=190148 RepID=UPI00081067E3|nr:hypothetical protein [Bradyrhizobium paxllaeri]